MVISKAVFMGRNGTIHPQPAYGILNPGDICLLPNVDKALNLLGRQGYYIAILARERENIPGIDYPSRLRWVEQWIRSDSPWPLGFRYCWHYYGRSCDCHLPNTGMIDAIRDEKNIDLSRSIMVASRESEAKGAMNAGIGTIVRIGTGRGEDKKEWSSKSEAYPIYADLWEATLAIFSSEEKVA